MARGVTLNATISARDAASKNINRVNKSLSGLGNTAKQIGSDFKRVALFTTGLAVAAGAFTAVAIKGAIADAAAQAKMMAVLKARGLATESVTKAIDAQISAAAKLGFTDDEVRASVETSTRFTKDYAVAQKMQTVAMDLARATGMTLEDATLQVGKAYSGTGDKLFKVLGITTKGIKGQKAFDAILSKTGGTAKAYGETTEGAFSALSIQAAELQESFGAAFLPAVTKLFIGLQPHLERFGNYIKAATPTIEKFTTELVDKLLAKLPGWIAAAEEKFPSILRQIGKFADDIKGVGKSADGLLGPGGSITLLVTGIGAAFGGLRGAIAANLLKGGVDPIKAYFIATISAGVLEGVIKGMTQALVAQATTKFLSLFKNIPLTVAPTGGMPGAGAAGTGWLASIGGVAGLGAVAAGVLSVAAVVAAAGALSNAITSSGMTDKVGGNGVVDVFGTTAATTAGGAPFDLGEFWKFVTTGQRTPAATVNPMTAKYTSNIYIGTGKVDTVVTDSLKRTGNLGRGR